MKRSTHIKTCCIAILIGIFTTSFALQAKSPKAPASKVACARVQLKYSLLRLEKMAIGTNDSQIQEVISYARTVLQAGCKTKCKKIKKALQDTLSAINYLNQLQTSPPSQPSEMSLVAQHFSQIQDEMGNILTTLKENSAYDLPTPIIFVPFTITSPGKYYVLRNLTYNGTQAAITINADNVYLDFLNNSLTLTNQSGAAILAQGVKEFTLADGSIRAASTNPTVSLVGVQKAAISNIYVSNSSTAIAVSGSSGLHIDNSYLSGAGIDINASQAIAINGCSFQGANGQSNALLIRGASQHIAVSDSTFNNWQNAIFANQVSGLQIEECLVKGSHVAPGPLLVLGTANSPANTIQIRNTTFEQQAPTVGQDGLLFVNGSGCQLENVLVDVATGHTESYQPAAIHVGAYDTLLVKSCIVKGPNEYGLYLEKSTHASCIDCQFTDATVANLFLSGTAGSVIKGCKVSDASRKRHSSCRWSNRQCRGRLRNQQQRTKWHKC